MSTFDKYRGQDVLISYLKKRSNKSYYGFLNLYRNIIVASLTSELCWNDLDNAWTGKYIREAEKIFRDQEFIETFKKKKVNEERLKHKKDLQTYWQGVIKEFNEKENLTPKNKLQSKTTKIPKDLPENSQLHAKQKAKLSRVRNNDNDTNDSSVELRKKKQKQDESKSDYYMQIADDVFLSAVAYEDLIKGNISSFIKLLEIRLSTRSQRSLSSANEPVLQAIVEFLLPSKHHVPELCLIMNNTKKKGNGKFGFLDIFVLGEEIKNYINLELKYITLVGLVRNNNGKQPKELSSNELKELDEILEKENEEILLKRPYVYYAKETNEWKKTTVGEILNNGIKQLERYIDVIAKGQATFKNSKAGVYDERIKIINSSNSSNKLIGFIIVVIGFHRIIWRSVNEKLTNYKYSKIR
ncbi:hypothetical protein RclHR1_10140001 [Rhizophagus clarus]|uniref:Uncharacterized protein n=1 Tax=Rhizophagus clarus TaxID=94130 RepID=A0A2Z6QSV3_9GLOM|nr:hypothetical protein RclHR1_10140001 [Rhizophagus clarus]GES97551.1 hypothetical protein GLOIN_2v1790294 [Rhizophagus clarus]